MIDFVRGLPVWIVAIAALAAMTAVGILNNAYFAWLHRRLPSIFRPRSLLMIFGLGIAVIAVGLMLNPLSEVQKEQVKQTAPR